MSKQWIAGIFLLLIIFIGYSFINSDIYTIPEDDSGVMCTAEAKLCPDGSYVGRVGPSCEFAECPGAR